MSLWGVTTAADASRQSAAPHSEAQRRPFTSYTVIQASCRGQGTLASFLEKRFSNQGPLLTFSPHRL